MPYLHPKTWEDGVMPLEEFDWHWARGKQLVFVPGPGRRKIPADVRRAVLERDGLVCGICGGDVEPHDIHLDHIYPHSLGGSDRWDNLQVAHSICNRRKGARLQWQESTPRSK